MNVEALTTNLGTLISKAATIPQTRLDAWSSRLGIRDVFPRANPRSTKDVVNVVRNHMKTIGGREQIEAGRLDRAKITTRILLQIFVRRRQSELRPLPLLQIGFGKIGLLVPNTIKSDLARVNLRVPFSTKIGLAKADLPVPSSTKSDLAKVDLPVHKTINLVDEIALTSRTTVAGHPRQHRHGDGASTIAIAVARPRRLRRRNLSFRQMRNDGPQLALSHPQPRPLPTCTRFSRPPSRQYPKAS